MFLCICSLLQTVQLQWGNVLLIIIFNIHRIQFKESLRLEVKDGVVGRLLPRTHSCSCLAFYRALGSALPLLADLLLRRIVVLYSR